MKIEWIKIDGTMIAIDKTTGEILNDSLDFLPADYDVKESVKGVLEDMFGETLITTAEIKTEKRGRKAKGVHNPYASFFSNVQYREDTGTSNMDDTLDDLVYSASTASTGNTRIPVKQLVHVMRSSDLSTKGVQEVLGKRRIIKGDKAPKERYCRDVVSAAEHLIKRIEAHQERGTINLNDASAFQFEIDNAAYERSAGLSKAMLCPVEFTEGDKRGIRAFAKAGEVAAINDFIQRITEHSGRMLERIKGGVPSVDSKAAYSELNAEFPYEPYEDDYGCSTKQKKSVSEVPVSMGSEVSEDWMYQIEMYVEERNPAMDSPIAISIFN